MKMIEDDRYCIDISKQILAAQSLMKKANQEILRDHIKTCVKDAIAKGEGDQKMDEIFALIERYGKAGV